MFEGQTESPADSRPEGPPGYPAGRDPAKELLVRLSAEKELIGRTLDALNEEDVDLIYRFWHQSFKVYGLQQLTLLIRDLLAGLAPEGCQLDGRYEQIVSEGTGRTFTLDANDRWLEETRPIVEAYLHSKNLLEAAYANAGVHDDMPTFLPSGLATLLVLYGLR